MSDLRVVVVGAGAAGLSTALQLARRDVEVTVIDKDYPASGSSGLSAGIFNRQTQDQLELELRCQSVEFLEELEAEGRLELVHNGYIRVARSGDDLERFVETIDAQRALGLTDTEVIDLDRMSELVPGMAVEDFAGGLYGPDDGSLDGHLLCGAYLELGEAEGVRFHPRTEILGVDDGPGDSIRIRTGDAQFVCDLVVNAAGGWAPRVAALLGIEMPVHNERHQVCIAHLGRPLSVLPPAVNSYVPGSGASALYFRPESTDRLLVGLHSHEVLGGESSDPDNFGRGVDFDYLEQVAEQLQSRLPGMSDIRLEDGWSGLYPISPDGLFQVGPHPADPRMVCAGGLGGVGLTVSPAIGMIAAEWIADGTAKAFAAADRLLPGRSGLSAPHAV